jgi:hypothetical protein
LLELVRYIHMNPVRAGLVDDPAEYRWSSHRAYLGEEKLPWLTTDWVLARFGRDLRDARHRFSAFVSQDCGRQYRPEFHEGSDEDNRILGDDAFISRILEVGEIERPNRASLQNVISAVCGVYGLYEEELRAAGKRRTPAEARAVAAVVVRELPGVSLFDLAYRLGRDVSTLSCSATRLLERAGRDHSVAQRLRRILELVESNARMQSLTPSAREHRPRAERMVRGVLPA